MTNPALFNMATVAKTTSATNVGTAQGTAAELLLASQLLERGHKVAVPLCDDDGVDLIVNYAIKVQVKSGGYRDPRKGEITIHLARRGYKHKGVPRALRTVPAHVDIIAAFATDTRTWWFIPRNEIHAVHNIRLLETAQHGLSAWKEAWELFDPTITTHPITLHHNDEAV